jgi:hypothetical protein
VIFDEVVDESFTILELIFLALPTIDDAVEFSFEVKL